MIQLRCLWRDTWALWLLVVVVTVLQVRYLGWFFLVNVPILLVTFVYFAMQRYDSDGNERSGVE